MSILLDHIRLAYGSRTLLTDASATLAPGTLTALIGRNGTGKSTLLRSVAGLAPAAGGRIELCGRPLDQLTPRQRAETVAFVTTDKVRIANLPCEDVVALGRAPLSSQNQILLSIQLTNEALSLSTGVSLCRVFGLSVICL